MKRSFIVFCIVALCALGLVLSKGHIGSKSLVYTEPVPPRVLTIEPAKEFISSVDREVLEIKVYQDGKEIEKGYRLSSENGAVAEINEDNKIQAVGNGKTTIELEYDGVKTQFEVRVITPIQSFSFTTTNSTVRVGKDLQLKLKTLPSGSSIDSLTYESSNEEVAKVNANGIVTGISEGKVTITVTDQYTGAQKTVDLMIRK